MLNDYNTKKDFMVEWYDNKGNLHKTKVLNKFVSADAAAAYIYTNRKTCVGDPFAYWI
jgi:hypothetical protein